MEKITDKKIYLAIDERIDRLDTLLINRISVLEDRIKYLEKVDKSYKNDIDDLEDKINNYQHEINLPKIINDLHKKNNKLNNKIDDLEEKINKCFNKFDKIDNRLDDLEDKTSNHFKYFDKLERLSHDSWFADNQKIKDLENNFSKLFAMVDGLETKVRIILKGIDDLETFQKTAEEVMSKLNNKIKYFGLMEAETMEIESSFMGRLDSLELWKSKLNDMDKILLNRIEYVEREIESVEREIPDINQDTDFTDRLNVKYDDLEAKNYQLKSELDGIYKVLEMDACDIQKLQDETITIKEFRKFKDWDEFNEREQKGDK